MIVVESGWSVGYNILLVWKVIPPRGDNISRQRCSYVLREIVLIYVPAILSVSAHFSGRSEALFARRDPGVPLTRLVMLSGSLRTGGDAHEFDKA